MRFAESLSRQARYAEAEPLHRELFELRRTNEGDLLSAKATLARCLADWAWAERSNSAVGDVARPAVNPANRESNSESKLAAPAAAALGQRAREAERLLRECLAEREAGTNTSVRRMADVRSRLGGAVLAVAVTDPTLNSEARENKFKEAEGLLLPSAEALQRSSSDPKYIRDALDRLARLYGAWNNPAQAAHWRSQLEAFDRTEKNRKAAAATEVRK